MSCILVGSNDITYLRSSWLLPVVCRDFRLSLWFCVTAVTAWKSAYVCNFNIWTVADVGLYKKAVLWQRNHTMPLWNSIPVEIYSVIARFSLPAREWHLGILLLYKESVGNGVTGIRCPSFIPISRPTCWGWRIGAHKCILSYIAAQCSHTPTGLDWKCTIISYLLFNIFIELTYLLPWCSLHYISLTCRPDIPADKKVGRQVGENQVQHFNARQHVPCWLFHPSANHRGGHGSAASAQFWRPDMIATYLGLFT